MEINFRTPKKIATAIIAFIAFIVILVERPLVTIKSTERGIVYRRWAVVGTLDQGLHMIMPFADNVRTVSITPIAMEVDIPVGAQGSITKDNQTIGTDLTVFYRFKSTELVNIAKNFGFDILKEKLAKDTTEAFKQTIGQYTIFDVASKQEEIRDKFILAVNEKIGAYPLFVDDIKVSNYDWSDSFDEQIALTMKIAQESKQQEQELKKIEISAQQQVVQAQANFDAEKLNAEAKKVKWEGIAAYNQAITSNTRNMELELKLKALEIEKILAEKWNGVRVSTNNYWPIPVSYLWETK